MKNIWYFIKFFNEEIFADKFLGGEMFCNRLSWFRDIEDSNDGRPDRYEAAAIWLQPKGLIMQFQNPFLGKFEITEKDFAGPTCFFFQRHDDLHLFCLYALYTDGFQIDGIKILHSPDDADKVKAQLHIDDRCQNFGKYAVITTAVPFLEQVKAAFIAQKITMKGRLVEYYDEETFNGEIAEEKIPFSKHSKYSYQKEWRFCIDSKTVDEGPRTINIGSIAAFSSKVKSSEGPS